MVDNNREYISIPKDEYNELLQRLKSAEIEKNKTERELRTIVKRNEIDKLNIETQIGLNRIIIDEKLKQEMYVHLLLESCPDPMFIFDEETKFLLGTNSISGFIGIDDIYILQGRELDSIVERYHPPVFTEQIITFIKNITSSRGNANAVKNLEITTENNRYEVNILPFRKDNGDFAGVLVIMHDITEIIKSKEIAEHASSAKGEFLSRMSHEIRTPLNAIIGMINIGLGSDDIEKKNYCFKRADTASKHLLGLISDILDMSKIEADKFELSFREFDFEQALRNITNMANVRAEEKQQIFIVNLGNDVPAFILNDELRLSQVITNLLTNAIKFTPEKGTVTLGIEKVEEINDDVILRIEVSDSGIGISKEQQERLFMPFNQADASIAQKFGGTGLGLAISKRIIELMGGRVWIESELGKGAKFIFTIKAKKAEGRTRTKLSEKINKDSIHILAVDDSEETRNYFIHVMAALKLSCDVASGGAQAIYMIKNAVERPYNIFFVDWQMPDMDGIELTRIINELSGDNSIVIMISAHDWNIIEKEAFAAGVKHFVSKPLFPSTLIDAINICMGSEMNETADDVQSETPKRHYDFYNHTLLIAEDVEINREIMSAILEETGISIDFAENGKEAVSKFKAHPDRYSLILMDIQMPEMGGYEAAVNIRSLDCENAKTIPIIAMTANVFKEDIEKCLAVGMNSHLGKPVDTDDLYEKLELYLPPKQEE
ncbi:MAG: response regulator [Leptospirales bacterium]|nr:response regulator [Leptospirales bacterium]